MINKFLNDDYIFWFILIDIFLLPYFNLIVIPISFFVIVAWAIKNRGIVKNSVDYKDLLVCSVFMLSSTIIGSMLNSPYSVAFDNFKRFLQYTISFEYLYFFRYYFRNRKVNLKKILYVFVLFVVGLAVLFKISPTAYSTICSIFNKGNSYISSSFLDSIYYGYTLRYGYIWTDQNNIAYALTGVIMFILLTCKHDFIETILLFCANVFVLLCSMSSGGWICFAISWLLYFIYRLFKFKKPSRMVSKKLLIGFVLLIIVFIYLLSNGFFSNFFESDLVFDALDRFKSNENSRTEIWLRILNQDNIAKYFLLGKGSTLIINGVNKAAHSGHLYWIYAYGMVSYFIFMKKFFYFGFRQVWKYLPVLSFFLCFTMNTMVGEQKLLLIFILIVSYLREVKKDEI